MIAKRQTTLLMCGLTVVAQLTFSKCHHPISLYTTNRRELQHFEVLARGLLDEKQPARLSELKKWRKTCKH
jgi:hypothetical protein